MTRAEYQAKYGASPDASIAPEPTKTLGQKVMGAAQGISNFVGAKGITDQFGASIARATLPKNLKNNVEEPGLKKVLGSAVQTGSMLIPGVGAGARLATKVGAGAATGYGLDVGSKLQSNKSVGDSLTPGVGTAIGAALPVAGAAVVRPATKILGRLFKGLGSGVSGVSTKTLDQILDNPQVAKKATQRLEQTGNNAVLEKNSKAIVNGIAKIRQEARGSFGQGLEKLSETDINPSLFREQTQSVLDKFGVVGGKSGRKLTGVEFDSPKLMKKASELINKLSNAKLDGKSLRKLSNDFDSAAFKTTGSDAERLSFNAFVKDLSSALQEAISKSTGKLGEINQKFSRDMQLVETMEDVFGSVNFKNLPEVVKASQKLESLFTQKGLAPQEIDNFLSRIGIGADDFKTSEAVRQITNREPRGLNTPGMTFGEITQAATGSIISPQMVRDLTIATGMAKEKLIPFLRGMSSSARKIVISALLAGGQDSE